MLSGTLVAAASDALHDFWRNRKKQFRRTCQEIEQAWQTLPPTRPNYRRTSQAADPEFDVEPPAITGLFEPCAVRADVQLAPKTPFDAESGGRTCSRSGVAVPPNAQRRSAPARTRRTQAAMNARNGASRSALALSRMTQSRLLQPVFAEPILAKTMSQGHPSPMKADT